MVEGRGVDQPGVSAGSTGRALRATLSGVALSIPLALVALGEARGGPEWIAPWLVAVVVLLVGLPFVASGYYSSHRTPTRTVLFLGQLVITVGLVAVLVRSRSMGLESEMHVYLFGAALAGYALAHPGTARFAPAQWTFAGCAAVVVAVFLHHAATLHPTTGSHRFVLWSAVAMTASAFVLPRYVPARATLWAIARLAALLVALGLPVYVVGDYEPLGMSVSHWRGTIVVPLYGTEVAAMRSAFPNPNTLGGVAFAGTVAAVVELHRRLAARTPLALVSAILLACTAVGTYLSNSRSSVVAAAVAVGVYLAYALGGPRTVPWTVVGAVGGVVAGLVAIRRGLVGIDAAGRFHLWRASLLAFLDAPTLTGLGIVGLNEVIAPHAGEYAGHSPHSSYLAMLLRAGLLGGVAYAVLVAGSALWAAASIRTDADRVAMLALAFGWAVHQLFEAYTLFRVSTLSILAALAAGYLLVPGEPGAGVGDGATP